MKCGHAGVLFRSRDNVVRGSNHLFQVIGAHADFCQQTGTAARLTANSEQEG